MKTARRARLAVRRWTGLDQGSWASVTFWRASSLVAALGLVAPVMRVGRRPYRALRLADRLDVLIKMGSIPGWTTGALQCFVIAGVVAALCGVCLMPNARHVALVPLIATFVAACAIWWASSKSASTTPTGELAGIGVAVAIAIVSSALVSKGTDRQDTNAQPGGPNVRPSDRDGASHRSFTVSS